MEIIQLSFASTVWLCSQSKVKTLQPSSKMLGKQVTTSRPRSKATLASHSPCRKRASSCSQATSQMWYPSGCRHGQCSRPKSYRKHSSKPPATSQLSVISSPCEWQDRPSHRKENQLTIIMLIYPMPKHRLQRSINNRLLPTTGTIACRRS